ncbi:unnamed protein product, partial [Symbiodinium sp. KB8]
MARQLADELAVRTGDWLEAVLLAARGAARGKCRGAALSDDLTWMTLIPPIMLPTREGAGSGPRYAPEPPPPKGERNRKLVEDGCIVGSLDPDRAALLLVGKTCASTLKRYLTDLVDFLLARRDEPCGRGWKGWLSFRRGAACDPWPPGLGRYKDKITEILSEGARLIKRAPRYPVYLLARLEELVLDPGHAIGWRVWAWAKLIKVCSRLLFFEHAFFVKSGWLKMKPAGYADAMVATAGLLGILGLPLELQGYWAEHSERSALPTALSLMEVPPKDKDLLGPLEGELDEREIAADLVPWLMERPKLSREQAELT